MISSSLAMLLQLTVLAAPTEAAEAETYAEAYQQNVETGRPLVVLVGAEWCPACVQMKRTVLPQLRQLGLLRRVAFAQVDLDRQQELGQKLVEGGPIPQLIICRKTTDGWHRRRLIGGQTVKTVEEALQGEIVAYQAEQERQAQRGAIKPTEKSHTDG